MNELKNLLEFRSQVPVSQEQAERMHEVLRPLLEQTNSELLIVDSTMTTTLHPSAAVVSGMEKLCGVIEEFTASNQRLVEVNQALLAYLIELDGVESPSMGSSLDGP